MTQAYTLEEYASFLADARQIQDDLTLLCQYADALDLGDIAGQIDDVTTRFMAAVRSIEVLPLVAPPQED